VKLYLEREKSATVYASMFLFVE